VPQVNVLTTYATVGQLLLLFDGLVFGYIFAP